ncbi:MAG: methionine--tRNA ligase [Candidatus Sumerlaea chitinivorans]|nr:methionine--tRNA ligase [Candidatus Sumerlaea chitinivorans]
MTMRRFYLTTAIPYANAEPHVGHVLELIGADIIARAKRLLGYEVYFQTGTDEHGQKMLEAARKAGKSPQKYADEIVPRFRDLWRDLDISHNGFVRTTDPAHRAGVTKFWRAVRDHGDIYLGQYEGWYCVPEETFVLESQVKAGEAGEKLCPQCGRELIWHSEENFVFRWSRYQEKLEQWIADHPDFIAPPFRANEMINSFLKPGLQDISISRTTIQWGIPVPEAENHVIYVWFDALLNYITGVGYGSDEERFQKWWPCDLHIVGKDILKFHTLLWPAMLMAAGLEPPRRVFGHGFVIARGEEKMSKSKGNVVDPRDILAMFNGNPDPLRYYLVCENDFGQDAVFSMDGLVSRYHADLADKLGNLLARTTAMITRYLEGRVVRPERFEEADEVVRDALLSLAELAPDASGRSIYEQFIDEGLFAQLLQRVMGAVSKMNAYVTEQQPWRLAKDPAKRERLTQVLYTLAEGLRLSAVLLFPFISRSAQAIWQQLGIEEPLSGASFSQEMRWGRLDGQRVSAGAILFPKLEKRS